MRYLILMAYALLMCFFLGSRSTCKADDSPGFFLKITKNVPRLGRRSVKEFESSFHNNYKNIPRIGRSGESGFRSLTSWLNENPAKSVNKRVLMRPISSIVADQELSVVQPVNANTLMELLDKNAIPSDDVKFVHWKDFDRALQLDAELYGKVISLGRKPDQRLKEDISMGGNFVPLIGNTVGVEGSDYMMYNRAGDWEGPYASDLLSYNRM